LYRVHNKQKCLASNVRRRINDFRSYPLSLESSILKEKRRGIWLVKNRHSNGIGTIIGVKSFLDNKPATPEFPTRVDSGKDCNPAWAPGNHWVLLLLYI
jgi:hypothetical protein